MYMQPNQFYRYSLKRGMSGWDVQACQIALNHSELNPKLVEDGIFGQLTELAAKNLQSHFKITIDGVMGPQTQSILCTNECNKIGHGKVPNNLLKGICLGESGGIIPATSSRYPNGSRDYGPFQSNLTSPTQQQLNLAFQPKHQAEKLSVELNNKYMTFLRFSHVLNSEMAWRLAVLSYNWPAAAEAIANGEENTWAYVENGAGIKRKLNDNAPWVEQYHIPDVKTGLAWCYHYVDSKSVYVTDWNI